MMCRGLLSDSSISVAGKRKLAVVIPVYATVQDDLKFLLYMLRELKKQRRQLDLLVLVDDASPLTVPEFTIQAMFPYPQVGADLLFCILQSARVCLGSQCLHIPTNGFVTA
jgi:hypothetical protein